MDDSFFFDSGLSLHGACAGNEVANLRLLSETFQIAISARDGGVSLSGDPEKVVEAKRFLEELAYFYQIHGRAIEQRDFELTLRSFTEETGGTLRQLWQEKIQVSPRKRDVYPRSRRQMEYVQARNCRTSSPEVDMEVSTAITKSSIRFSSLVSGGSTSGILP